MRVAVTGGSGRIGTVLCRELVARGHDVINLDRRPPTGESAGRFVLLDLADLASREPVRALLGQVEAVCHLGEIPNVHHGPSPDEVFAQNTRAGATVLQAAADLKLRRAIYTSSAQVYGFWDHPAATPLRLPFDETHPVTPHNAYAMGKVANEGYARMLAERQGLSVAAFRFVWVRVEDYDDEHARSLRTMPPRTDGFATYVHVSDVARGYALALENPRPGFEAYHFSAPEIASLQPLRQRLAAHHPDYPPLPADWPDFKSPLLTTKLREHFGWEAKWNYLDFYRARHGEPGGF
jgi:nucleoside-diphosphate-sugar epimerase